MSLSNEAYMKLKALKMSKSFSEAILDLVERRKKKRNLMKFAGAFRNNADEWEDIKKKIYEDREKLKLRTYKL